MAFHVLAIFLSLFASLVIVLIDYREMYLNLRKPS